MSNTSRAKKYEGVDLASLAQVFGRMKKDQNAVNIMDHPPSKDISIGLQSSCHRPSELSSPYRKEEEHVVVFIPGDSYHVGKTKQ